MKKSSIRGFLAVASICSIFFVTYMLFYQPVPDGSRDALNMVLGILSANLTAIGSFYFGSSQAQTVVKKKEEPLASGKE